MFSDKYNLMCDGEFLYGTDSWEDILQAFNDCVESKRDHEYQILEIILGAR